MTTEYHVKLTYEDNQQTLQIPPELSLSSQEVILRQEGTKLIIEPCPRKRLLKTLATLEDLDEDFPDLDEGLLPLDDIDL